MTVERYIGVDGCRAGWFFAAIDAGGGAEFGIAGGVADLWAAHGGTGPVLIDIPIGLISTAVGGRDCDAAARGVLKPLRHSSIFSPPCRQALAAPDYAAACRINRQICGRKISIQAWGIAAKIRQVDDFLQCTPAARGTVRETHPEVCFRALAGGTPMAQGKKTAEGRTRRLDLLRKAYPPSKSVFEAALTRYPRRHLAPDDILDALVNAVTATRLAAAGATLPADPPIDQRGLAMEIVYAQHPSHPVWGRAGHRVNRGS